MKRLQQADVATAQAVGDPGRIRHESPPPSTRADTLYADDEARWRAVVARDANAAGYFVYAVRTTGTYAQPGAAARLPKRENVEFFATVEAAEAAGYRASRHGTVEHADRARVHLALVERACRAMETQSPAPRLEQLAAQAGLSASRFHRVFKAATGLTPRAYAAAHRARRLREGLGTPALSVTDAIYEAGFNATSRYYEGARQRLGMRARDYRTGGAGSVIRFAVGQCSLGAILVAQSEQGICAISLGEDPEVLVTEVQDQFPNAELIGGDTAFERLVAQVVGLVEAPGTGLNLPLDVRGTVFQERVWQALRDIPSGVRVTYTDIARAIGAPQAVRAVAQACGANRIAVAIPCHRVVRRDGGLSGYRWGVERKRELLRREAGAQA